MPNRCFLFRFSLFSVSFRCRATDIEPLLRNVGSFFLQHLEVLIVLFVKKQPIKVGN